MGSRRAFVLVGAMAIVWAAPERASACSSLDPCVERPLLTLVGDVSSRPRNACVGVRYVEAELLDDPIAPELAYVAADGTRIALAAAETRRVFCPTSTLEPDTDYTLVGPRVDVASVECDVGEEMALLAFHTSATLDTTPPSAPGTIEDFSCSHEVCDSGACCGPYDIIEHLALWDAATDDGAAVAYAIDGELRTTTRRQWAERLSSQPTTVWVFEDQPHEVRAIDIAGNLSEPAMHGAPCVPAPIEPDAGVPETPDAGATATDASMPSSGGGGGCSITARDERSSAWLLALVGVLLVRHRRRASARVSQNPMQMGDA